MQPRSNALQRALLLCGLLSSIVYVITDVIGALSYPDYDYAAQAISEMTAIGAPTANLLAPFYWTFSILFLAFAIGVWLFGRQGSCLRWSASFMFGVVVVGVGFSFFPMNMRGVGRTFSDTMHLLIAGVTMILLTGAIICGSKALKPTFRFYSALTVALMLVFFVLTLLDAPNVARNLSTPYMGLKERVSMAAWLAWIAVFSVQLLKVGPKPESITRL